MQAALQPTLFLWQNCIVPAMWPTMHGVGRCGATRASECIMACFGPNVHQRSANGAHGVHGIWYRPHQASGRAATQRYPTMHAVQRRNSYSRNRCGLAAAVAGCARLHVAFRQLSGSAAPELTSVGRGWGSDRPSSRILTPRERSCFVSQEQTFVQHTRHSKSL